MRWPLYRFSCQKWPKSKQDLNFIWQLWNSVLLWTKFSVLSAKATLYFYILDSFTNEDSTKLEEITTSVLKPSKNREERKERVKKYLQWVRTITSTNNRFFLLWNERLVWDWVKATAPKVFAQFSFSKWFKARVSSFQLLFNLKFIRYISLWLQWIVMGTGYDVISDLKSSQC